MTTLTNNYAEQFTQAVSDGISAGIVFFIIMILISLAVFALYVAVATIVVKKIWFSDIGGKPWRYR